MTKSLDPKVTRIKDEIIVKEEFTHKLHELIVYYGIDEEVGVHSEIVCKMMLSSLAYQKSCLSMLDKYLKVQTLTDGEIDSPARLLMEEEHEVDNLIDNGYTPEEIKNSIQRIEDIKVEYKEFL